MRRHLVALATALALAFLAPFSMAQSPGLTDGVQAPDVQAPTSLQPPQHGMAWNLSDLLWGLTRLESSPRKLTEEQKVQVRPALERVLEGAELVRNFDSRVERILTTDQVAYIQHLALTGALAGDPLDLPIVPPGQDPLVVYVVQLLEAKAK